MSLFHTFRIKFKGSLADFLTDFLKRKALQVCHKTALGRASVLGVYLWAEENAEKSVLAMIQDSDPSPAIKKQLLKHSEDEKNHVILLQSCVARTGRAPLLNCERLGRDQFTRYDALLDRYSSRFQAGQLVPLFAVAKVLESMVLVVFGRHISVLEQNPSLSGQDQQILETLKKIVFDENYHVALCDRALSLLVQPSEKEELETLLIEITRLEKKGSLRDAVGSLLLGYLTWGLEGLGYGQTPTSAQSA